MESLLSAVEVDVARSAARRNGDHGDIRIVVIVAPSPPITVALWPVDTSNNVVDTRLASSRAATN
jgi:hypothetical protein